MPVSASSSDEARTSTAPRSSAPPAIGSIAHRSSTTASLQGSSGSTRASSPASTTWRISASRPGALSEPAS